MTKIRVSDNDLDEDPGFCLYKGEKFTGIGLAYDGDGNLTGETHFKDGLQCGIQLSLYTDGSLEIVSYSVNYMICGPELEYSIDGSLSKEKWFFMGTPIPKPNKKPERPLAPDNECIWNDLEGFSIDRLDFTKEISEINGVLEKFGKTKIDYRAI